MLFITAIIAVMDGTGKVSRDMLSLPGIARTTSSPSGN